MKRDAPVIVDIPTIANSIPRQQESRPRGIDSPAMEPMTVNANSSRNTFSIGPACNEISEIGAATRISTRVASISPVTDANSDISSALPALPALVSAWPSNAVRKEAAAPGVLIRIAEIDPP